VDCQCGECHGFVHRCDNDGCEKVQKNTECGEFRVGQRIICIELDGDTMHFCSIKCMVRELKLNHIKKTKAEKWESGE
jgi:ribosomal protein L24E